MQLQKRRHSSETSLFCQSLQLKFQKTSKTTAEFSYIHRVREDKNKCIIQRVYFGEAGAVIKTYLVIIVIIQNMYILK